MKRVDKIPGVEIRKKERYLIALISELSDELKAIIRERLSSICHGANYALMDRANYTYTRTVEEFLKRINPKTQKVKTGMLGELLVHVLSGIVYPGYKTIVPYFNLEERNIKKGFDSVIYSADLGIWVYEVKSSQKKTPKGRADSKIKDLVRIAHKDLSEKLAVQDEAGRLWGQAMNGLQVAYGHLNDEKAVLEQIILGHQEEAETPQCGPDRHNVILCSVLMSGEELEISNKCIEERLTDYESTYNDLMVYAVHKSILIDLFAFFEEEVSGEAA